MAGAEAWKSVHEQAPRERIEGVEAREYVNEQFAAAGLRGPKG